MNEARNKNKLIWILLLSVGTALPVVADAQIYMCKDAKGRTISSDRPIPECADRAMREMQKNGVFKREIPAPLTAEEKKQQEIANARLKAQAVAQEEQRKSDRALMARYQNQGDIENARQRTLSVARDQLKREQLAMELSDKQLAQSQTEAEAYKKKRSKLPSVLEQKIADGERAHDESTKLIAEREDEVAQINTRFDETLKRFNDLTGGKVSKNF